MKRQLAGALAALAWMSAAAFADPLEGTWKTEPDDGAYAHVAIAPCGPAFCGRILRTFNASGEYRSPNIGRVMVIDMTPQGGGKYRGQVWRPSNDKVYDGKITLEGDRLRLAGCVAGGLLCARQSWERVK